MRKPCSHNVHLSKGLKCDHGYIQVRLDQIGVCRNFGPHTPESQEVASIFLAEQRKRILMGKAGIAVQDPQITFAEVARLHHKIWIDERDDDGNLKHSKDAIYMHNNIVEASLIPAFGKLMFDELETYQVNDWRHDLTVNKHISGTTVNRYQNVLSGIYTDVAKLIKAKKIKKPFRLPASNPCAAADWAESKIRKLIWSKSQLQDLFKAFKALKDEDGWEICKLALKSVLSLKDLKAVEKGYSIDTVRAKTGVPVKLPITVLVELNWRNWRNRFEAARDKAGVTVYKEEDGKRLVDTSRTPTFRDLRKTGINALTGKGFDPKLVSQYVGHASTKTTERVYQLRIDEKLKPLADEADNWVKSLED